MSGVGKLFPKSQAVFQIFQAKRKSRRLRRSLHYHLKRDHSKIHKDQREHLDATEAWVPDPRRLPPFRPRRQRPQPQPAPQSSGWPPGPAASGRRRLPVSEQRADATWILARTPGGAAGSEHACAHRAASLTHPTVEERGDPQTAQSQASLCPHYSKSSTTPQLLNVWSRRPWVQTALLRNLSEIQNFNFILDLPNHCLQVEQDPRGSRRILTFDSVAFTIKIRQGNKKTHQHRNTSYKLNF